MTALLKKVNLGTCGQTLVPIGSPHYPWSSRSVVFFVLIKKSRFALGLDIRTSVIAHISVVGLNDFHTGEKGNCVCEMTGYYTLSEPYTLYQILYLVRTTKFKGVSLLIKTMISLRKSLSITAFIPVTGRSQEGSSAV